MAPSDPSRPPVHPPARAKLDASGSTSTSPRQSGPPSRLALSSGLSSNDTVPSSSSEDENILVQAPVPKVGGSGAEFTVKFGGKAAGVKRARELTPQSDMGDEAKPNEASDSGTPVKLTSMIKEMNEEAKKDVKYCHQYVSQPCLGPGRGSPCTGHRSSTLPCLHPSGITNLTRPAQSSPAKPKSPTASRARWPTVAAA